MGRLTCTQGWQSKIVGQNLMQVAVAVVSRKVTKETWDEVCVPLRGVRRPLDRSGAMYVELRR